MSQLKKEVNLPFLSAFCCYYMWVLSGSDDVHPHRVGTSSLLSLLTPTLTLSQTYPDMTFYQLSGHPQAQSG